MMKIMHVVSAPAPGGAEIYVKDLAKALSESGHRIHIGFVDRNHASSLESAFGKAYLRDLESAGIRYFFLPPDARQQPWRGMREIQKYAAEAEIDVYHSHLTYGIVFGALLRVPRIYTHHNIKMRVGPIAFALLVRFVERLVGISSACSSALERHSHRDVVTILNGIDTRRFADRAVRELEPGRQIRCIAVGRVCEQKNYRLLIQAIAELPLEVRGRIELKIVGGGKDNDVGRVRQAIAESGLEDSVQLLGVRDDVPALLANADLFLMSSAFEGLPIALIEATVAGLPAVVTDVGGCREVIERCDSGVCVKPGDKQLFRGAILDVISDAARYSTLSQNALRRSRIFSIEKARDDHLLLYRSVCRAQK